MPTLILSPRYTQDSIDLWRCATEIGWKVERTTSWRISTNLLENTLVLYGETLFAAVVSQTLNITLLEPKASWLSEIPFKHCLRNIEFSSLGKARELKHTAFIKPAEDKCFPAKVYNSGLELPLVDVLSDETPVLISEPVEWEVEFRCFVVENQVATISVYSRNGMLAQNSLGEWISSNSETTTALNFANKTLKEIGNTLPISVVLDVGIISNRGWAVVEANACWASGIYGCDPAKVLKVLEKAVIR
jgi:hypothetical protein